MHGDRGLVRVAQHEVQRQAALRHPLHAHHTTAEVLDLLTGHDEPTNGTASPSHAGRPGTRGARDRFREAFLAAPAGVAIADADRRLIAVNAALSRLLGFSESALRGRGLRDLVHPDGIAAVEQGLAELAKGERSEYTGETRLMRNGGAPVWAELRATMAHDPQTGSRMYVAHLVDITERKRQANVLVEAEERFRSAFDNAPIGMALVAPDGRWLKVNRALCELTGYTETALLVRTFQSITHPDDLDTDLAYVEDVLAGRRRTYQMEKRYRHADGHLIWVMLNVSLVRDPTGDPLYFISQIEDITERKRR